MAGIALLLVEVLWTYHHFATFIKWLTLVLLLYVLSGFLAHPAWRDVFTGTVVPKLAWDHDTIAAAVAILGTTISPYMFFWIASQEVEEELATAPGAGQTATSERERRRDVVTGMAYANVVFYFIVLASAATLGAHGVHVDTAGQAAEALEPIVGRLDSVVFAVGLIGAGMIAVPVLAGSSAYPMAELFGWREGLEKTVRQAPGFYAILTASVALGIAGNFLGIDPVQGLVYAAILQGVLAPVLLVLLTSVARDPDVMGEHRNAWFDTVFGYATAAIMAAASIALLLVSL
jgi:Mn2+/Fe2+ NRAMP family transporter